MAGLEFTPLLSAMRTFQDPKRIGAWKLGRTLGRGATGRVKLARHAKTGSMSAIKMVAKSPLLAHKESLNIAAEEAEERDRAVQREIIIMKLINHPNIMRLYDVWDTPNEIYLVLEYIQGGELFDYLCEKGKLTPEEALVYFQQIIFAVDYCHHFNIAHRDLKPENILLDHDMNIKVADFGMATLQTGGSLLQTACGSPHYAAPEIIDGQLYDGKAADVWSCGIILYALLAGRLPYETDDLNSIMEKINTGKMEIPSDLPPLAQDLLRRMLTKDVKQRITMTGIKHHPFFISQPPKQIQPTVPSLDELSCPVKSPGTIDPDILGSLSLLWRNIDLEELTESLTSPETNWQKAVYHLLEEYRRKSQVYELEEQAKIAKINRRRMKASKKPDLPTVGSFPSGQMLPQSPETPLSPISVPEHDDEMIQAFFNQIVDHLNILHVRTGSPLLGSENILSPVHAVFGPSTNLVLAPTKPLTVRRKQRQNRPSLKNAFDLCEKENADIEDDYSIIEYEGDIYPNNQSRRARSKSMNPKSLQRARSKLRKKRAHSDNPRSPSVANSIASSFGFTPLPTVPVNAWFANVFKFKPTNCTLLSAYEPEDTKAECRRLLANLDVRIVNEDLNGLGILFCSIGEGSGDVKFRVEVHQVITPPEYEGSMYSIVLIHEKGPMEDFKELYKQLSTEWVLDQPVASHGVEVG